MNECVSMCVDEEEEGHHEKGPSKVLKKVKEKAKKIKNVLTKHGHGHEHDRGEQQHIPDDHDLDEEDTEDYDVGQQVHGGAPGRSIIPSLALLHFKISLCFGIN